MAEEAEVARAVSCWAAPETEVAEVADGLCISIKLPRLACVNVRLLGARRRAIAVSAMRAPLTPAELSAATRALLGSAADEARERARASEAHAAAEGRSVWFQPVARGGREPAARPAAAPPMGSRVLEDGRVEFSASFALHGTWPWSVRAADVSYDYASSDGWLHVYVDKLRLSPTVKRSLVADLAARVRAGGNVFAPFAGTSVEVRW